MIPSLTEIYLISDMLPRRAPITYRGRPPAGTLRGRGVARAQDQPEPEVVLKYCRYYYFYYFVDRIAIFVLLENLKNILVELKYLMKYFCEF
ncbi:MAG: hypothetical protein Q8887_02590, partial [Candidatus Phytoplasma australasiaticum]|nr:hypothetical protein [Candidatus Phytoplasma australasiaticum]